MSQLSVDQGGATADLGLSFTPLIAAVQSAEDTPAIQAPVPVAAGADIRISVLDSLDAAERSWRTLEPRSDCTAFQAYDWVAAWQRHIGDLHDTRPAIVVGEGADGHPLFVLALAVEKHRGLKCLTWLGSDLCDYNAPILDRDFAAGLDGDRFDALWRLALERLADHPRLQFDYVDLQRMPETIGAARNPFLALSPDLHPSGAHACTLSGDWEHFYAAKRSAATRKTVRKKLKHLAKYGAVAFVDAQDIPDRQRTLDVLIDQKSQSLARMGVENFLDRPGYQEFFRAVTSDPAMRGLVHIARLDLGTMTAATSIGLTFGGCFYLIVASYDGGEVSRHGPGAAHLNELLRYAIEHDCHQFDFTVGDEGYKRDWGDITIRLYDYLSARSLRSFPLVFATKQYRRLKRFIKQTPVLWHAFSALRARFGGPATASGHRDDG